MHKKSFWLRSSISVLTLLLVLAASANAQLKPAVRGLMDRDVIVGGNVTMPNAEQFGFVDYVVANVEWSKLERATADGRGSFKQFNGLDMPGWKTIDEVIALNRVKGIRLRILAGVDAPDFVKQIDTTPISAQGDGETPAIDCSIKADGTGGGIAVKTGTGKKASERGCTTAFWKDRVIEQYEELMAEVARRYENVTKVSDVVNSGCMTIFAEPFYRGQRDVGSNERLWQAGLREWKDKACHERVMQAHNNIFIKTRTSIAVSPWDIIKNENARIIREKSWTDTRDFINYWRGVMQEKLVLQNNGLGETDGCVDGNSPGGQQFCYLAGVKNQFIGFQTERFEVLGDDRGLIKALRSGQNMGAVFIELPGAYRAELSNATIDTLRNIDRELESNQ